MWWLGVQPRELLAVFCDKSQSKQEPFKSAKSLASNQFHLTTSVEKSLSMEKSTDVGSEGWSSRMTAVKACFQAMEAFPFVQDVAAVGIGPNKESSQRAAYLALVIASVSALGDHSHQDTSERLKPLADEAAKALRLTPGSQGESRFCFEDASVGVDLISCRRSYAVVWHVSGPVGFRAYFSEDRSDAERRFQQLCGGPYAAALLDSQGALLERYGRYGFKHHLWGQLKAWWRSKLHGGSEGTSYRPSKRFRKNARNCNASVCSIEIQ